MSRLKLSFLMYDENLAETVRKTRTFLGRRQEPWDSENPRVIVDKPLYPQRVTVWCELWSAGVIGPYFFENEAEATITMNGLRYREMINEFFMAEIG